MSTKPFNLADALAGKPVVTRDGRKVVRVLHMPEATGSGCKVGALTPQIGGVIGLTLHYETGRFYERSDCDDDLFMAAKKVERFVLVRRVAGELRVSGHRVFRTRADAEDARREMPQCEPMQVVSTTIEV